MTIGERIRVLRKEHLGKTQEEFSDYIGLSRANIANIEVGRIAATDRVISDICDEFNVHETWLRTGEGEIFLRPSRDQYIADMVGSALGEERGSFKHRLIAALSRLTADEWEILEKIADHIKNGPDD